jgi:NTP pyrophosphatase (non-canonical NTP hydrolase)
MWGFFIQANISDKIIKKYEKNLDDYEKLNKDIISSSVQYMNSHQVILKIYKMLANSNVTQEDKKEYVFEVVKKALENYLDENQNQIQKFIEDTEGEKIMDDKQKIYKYAIQKWGTTTQLHQLMEEAAELIVSVSHYIRDREYALDNLIEETADVTIMLEQLTEIFGNDFTNKVEEIKIEKLNRLKNKLEV